jgi:hypothetical protein
MTYLDLQEQGVELDVGLLEALSRCQHRKSFSYIRTSLASALTRRSNQQDPKWLRVEDVLRS